MLLQRYLHVWNQQHLVLGVLDGSDDVYSACSARHRWVRLGYRLSYNQELVGEFEDFDVLPEGHLVVEIP